MEGFYICQMEQLHLHIKKNWGEMFKHLNNCQKTKNKANPWNIAFISYILIIGKRIAISTIKSEF